MGNSSNMTLVNHYFDDVLRDGKHEILDDIIHEAYIPQKTQDIDITKDDLRKIAGIEGIKTRIKLLSEQFGDLNFTRMDIVETKETVVVHYNVTTTHIGTWKEIHATDTKISTTGFHLFKFKDGKIFSTTWVLNITDILSQLGAAIKSEKDSLLEYLDIIKKLLKL
ncbi:MAG: ester cyclase [Candidatus Heimdallarchaeota archaeon]|nr:ester cyclase [Candidatus Heimdallarchaeota archaeon]